MIVQLILWDRRHLPFGDYRVRECHWGITTDLRNKVSKVAFVALIGKRTAEDGQGVVSMGLQVLHLLMSSV